MINFKKTLFGFLKKEIKIGFLKSTRLTLLIIIYGIILLLMFFLFHIHFVGINGLFFIILASFFHGISGGLLASIWVSGIITLFVIFYQYSNLYIIISSILAEVIIGISLGKAIDIYKKQKSNLKESEKKFRTYIENAPIGVFVADKEGNYMEVNDKGALMLNYKKSELLEMSVYDISATKTNKAKNVYKILKKQGKISFEGEFISRNKKKFKAKINAVKINENKFLGFVEDITLRVKKEEEIKYLSFHDQLTGLYNRRYFENEMERLNKSRRLPISIVIADMDELKKINDNYGHKMGDRYIKKAAEIINSATRSGDVVARIGGDEFVIILPGTNTNLAKELCERIQNKFKQYNRTSKLPKSLSISLGFATKEKRDDDLNKVFNKADKMMYENKEQSR